MHTHTHTHSDKHVNQTKSLTDGDKTTPFHIAVDLVVVVIVVVASA